MQQQILTMSIFGRMKKHHFLSYNSDARNRKYGHKFDVWMVMRNDMCHVVLSATEVYGNSRYYNATFVRHLRVTAGWST